MDLKLKGKVALVTGAGSQIGFGRAICLTLAQEGCNIIVNDIDGENAEKTASSLRELGCRSVAIKADVTKRTEVEEMVKKSLDLFGKIDILVNNAGAMVQPKPFVEQEEDIWDREIALNLKGAMICSQAVLPHMMERRYGKIINISSGAVRRVFPYISTYIIAKGGLEVFTRSLAKMVAPLGIIVNCVAPGWALTNFVKGDKEATRKAFLPETPIGRETKPQDVANLVTFLASDLSEDIVGQVIGVDGGSTLQ